MSCAFKVYVQANKEAEHNEELQLAAREFFQKLEQHDSQAMSLWQQFREITVKEYQQVYKVHIPRTRSRVTQGLITDLARQVERDFAKSLPLYDAFPSET